MREWRRGLLAAALALTLVERAESNSVRREPKATKKWTIQMIGYSPVQNDDYVAVSMPAPTGYIVAYEPMAHADRVHHILIYGCGTIQTEVKFWRGQQTCSGGASHILYAWARNAPNLILPKGVGFQVGGDSDIQSIVMQVHYAAPFAGNLRDFSGVTLNIVEEAPPNLAAVLLLVTGQPIPPRTKQFQDNMTCVYDSDTVIHPFAFRTHTHQMGRVVSSFYKRDGHWTKIGVRNPQWPQLFESIPRSLSIQKGDFIAGTCRFDSSDKDDSTPMGSMGSNEMCNFYMMLYWKASDPNPFPQGAYCTNTPPPHSMDDYPREGTDLLPSRPELEHHAHQSGVPFGVIEEGKVSTIGGVKLGQISGLSFDSNNNLVIFHRGSRLWDGTTFDAQNRLIDQTPIAEDTMLYVKFTGANDTTLISKTGAGLFYLPHGIFIDKDDSIYVTDVGSHTVSKYTRAANGSLVRWWQAGEPLVPGSGSSHFCKPTAITRLGDSLFVTDGYCNSRIVEMTLEGSYKTSFGAPQGARLIIPHDIVHTEKNELVVADRENGRVYQLRSDGSEVSQFTSSLFNNIYSADAHGDNIYMIPGDVRQSRFGGEELPVQVFAGRAGTGLTEFAFAPTTGPFVRPHIIRVCPHGDHFYIGDLGSDGGILWKFRVQHEGGTHELGGGVGSSSLFSLPGAVSVDGQTGRASTYIILLLLASVAVITAIVIRRGCRDPSPQARFDRKGFKPLRMDEKLGVSSDESDLD